MHVYRLLLASLALAAVALACRPAAIESTSAPVGPLLTITTRGGLCPDGPCGSTVVVERDGRIHEISPRIADLGTIPVEQVTTILAAIASTDFEALRLHRFTGQCPVAFDGQETIYQFATPGGIERIASCETEIDEDHPLFVAIRDALATGRAS